MQTAERLGNATLFTGVKLTEFYVNACYLQKEARKD